MAVSDQELYDEAGDAIREILKSQEYRVGSNSVNRTNRRADLLSAWALRRELGQILDAENGGNVGVASFNEPSGAT